MASIQRKFAACLITLFIISSIGYTCPTIKRTPDDCNEDCNLANKIRDCLTNKKNDFENVYVTNGKIEVVLKAKTDTPVSCSRIVDPIIECAQIAVDYQEGHVITILIAPSTQSDPAYIVYKGHTGTGTIPDSMICIDVLALKGILNIKTCNVERKVSEDVKRLGIKIENLNVKVKKGEDNKFYLQVSGNVRTSEVSERRVKGEVITLVRKYTGAQRINTDNLKVLPTSGKDSRIK